MLPVMCAVVCVACTVQTLGGAGEHLFGRRVLYGIAMALAVVWTPLVYLRNLRWFGAIVPPVAPGSGYRWRVK